MENYSKGKNVEEPFDKDNIPIPNLQPDFLWMHVKGGTKIFNVLQHARKIFDKKEARQVVWSANGGGVSKAITCAEIMKRDYYPLHQITKICYTKVEEYWDPKIEDLEQIVVTRQIPAIHILLSIDEIDTNELGYQPPDSTNTFWNTDTGPSQPVKKFKPRFDYYKSNSGSGSRQSPNVAEEFAQMGLQSGETKKRLKANDFKGPVTEISGMQN
ncbi:ribonuclease P protein subunit p25-like protein isoform X2 [Ctenocephalides felis]|uniref:ribonuclease P protein subunit p25-like protein isoform X2 n=1 Tax=Ctenocephalides felis TaxID=7515 RepID=UPI000E6E1AAE|nr:ribonuclease P protein subunit p25-like protein isoform X2 [Ctenocephalides felis]